jgi:predicted MFS family arabinose efflux permease
VITGLCSGVGVVIAGALLRWSARPARRFVWIAGSLTVVSLVPPLLSGGDTATVATLVGLHLVAATVMIPVLARTLRDAGRRTAPQEALVSSAVGCTSESTKPTAR